MVGDSLTAVGLALFLIILLTLVVSVIGLETALISYQMHRIRTLEARIGRLETSLEVYRENQFDARKRVSERLDRLSVQIAEIGAANLPYAAQDTRPPIGEYRHFPGENNTTHG
jgi:hypothetical protein